VKKTPLHQVHIGLQAKMAEFAGYDMPIQYPEGVLAEHQLPRETHAGLFDVSHMGQVTTSAARAQRPLLERLTPSRLRPAGKHGACKYTVMMNDDGGMVDDLIVTRLSDDTYSSAVINAGCKDKDIAWIRAAPGFRPISRSPVIDDRALLALQGPESERVLREALEIDAANARIICATWRTGAVHAVPAGIYGRGRI
jgi:aminomethyltransferase